MESDGRIRSKDIGTGEVNSRALDNIRSSNFDGSHTDPENDPGTQGWQILKNGIVVFNNAIIRGTLKAAKILSGTLNIGTGGTITLGDESAPTAILSETGIVVGPTTLDSSGVDIGPTSLSSTGVQVGTDVVMDSTGLWVNLGFVTPSWPFRGADGATNASLTTTPTAHVSVVISPPAWVQQLNVTASLSFQMGASSDQQMRFRIDGNGVPGTGVFSHQVVSGTTQCVSRVRSFEISSFPATIDGLAAVSSGTNSVNSLRLDVTATGIRT